ncbi:PIF1-like helicase domain-containing protein [Trichoderma compactum]
MRFLYVHLPSSHPSTIVTFNLIDTIENFLAVAWYHHHRYATRCTMATLSVICVGAQYRQSIEIGSPLLSEALTTVDLMPKQPYKIGDGPTLLPEQEDLVSRAVEGHNIFYTGSAGCGKPTVLREIRDRLIGMVLLKRFSNADTIILDEVSMMEAMHFDRLNEFMKAAYSPFEEGSTLPFGGTQIIVTGISVSCPRDLVPNRRQNTYKCPSTECGASYHDDDKWAFRSKAWDECNLEHVYLKEVHRQTDPKFVKLLQKYRLGLGMNDSELGLLANCNKTTDSYAVRLFPTREEVRKVNGAEFRLINAPVQTYKCADVFLGKRTKNADNSLKELKDHTFEIKLDLKEGMQVLLLHNISIPDELVNGAQGPEHDVNKEKILEFMMGCTTSIVPQARATPKDLYATILETEMPTWLAEAHLSSALPPHEKFHTGPADDTLYAMWIGVNDVGKKNIFIDSQTPGTSLTTFTDGVFTAFDRIYKNGGRKIVLMNVPPLELHPIYATPENKGPSNLTEVAFKMYEYTSAVNEIFTFQVLFQQHVAKRYPGAKWAIYGEHELVLPL